MSRTTDEEEREYAAMERYAQRLTDRSAERLRLGVTEGQMNEINRAAAEAGAVRKAEMQAAWEFNIERGMETMDAERPVRSRVTTEEPTMGAGGGGGTSARPLNVRTEPDKERGSLDEIESRIKALGGVSGGHRIRLGNLCDRLFGCRPEPGGEPDVPPPMGACSALIHEIEVVRDILTDVEYMIERLENL